MATATVVREWPDGESLTISIDVDESYMGSHAVSTTVLIGRKRAELDVIMLAASIKDVRGFDTQRQKNELYAEWDVAYDEWCLLRLRADIEAMDEPAAESA